jgi:hypothetical protein
MIAGEMTGCFKRLQSFLQDLLLFVAEYRSQGLVPDAAPPGKYGQAPE